MEGRFHTFAFPLTALVDAQKLEPGVSDLRMLAKQLGRWFVSELSIRHKGVVIEGTPDGPVFIIAGIEESDWPRMIALAKAQSCRLFLVLRGENGAMQLKEMTLPAD
ncbi:MAG: hypothetical protein ACKORB_05285 [Opitutia bacterium]|jgi:hypothetical protein